MSNKEVSESKHITMKPIIRTADDIIRDKINEHESETKHQSCLNLVNQLQNLINNPTDRSVSLTYEDKNDHTHNYNSECSELKDFIDRNNQKSTNIKFYLEPDNLNSVNYISTEVDISKKQILYKLYELPNRYYENYL